MKQLCEAHSEFEVLTLTEENNQYRIHSDEYYQGEVISQSDWIFPTGSLPDELVILLCEADFSKPLAYEHQKLMWKLLTYDDYQV